MKLKKIALVFALVTAVTAAVLSLGACGNKKKAGNYVIGVIPFDDTSAEQLEWNDYLKNYVAQNIAGVTFKFVSAPGTDGAKAVAAVEELKLAGCNAILGVIDTPAAIEKANELGMYFVRSGGLSVMADYNAVKNLPYYLGTLGPSLVEEKQAGHDMVTYFLGQGKKNLLVFAGLLGLGFPSEMHIERYKGVIEALTEAGLTYTAPANNTMYTGDDMGSFNEGSTGIEVTVIRGLAGAEYLDATFNQRFTDAVSGKTFDVVILILEGVQAVKTQLGSSHGTPVYGEIGSFNSNTKATFDSGDSAYLAGKYASSMGPAVAALINAIDGHKDIIKNADGAGCRMASPFWTATSKADFEEKYTFDSIGNPAFNKAILESAIVRLNNTVTRESFTAFAAYGYNELKAKR